MTDNVIERKIRMALEWHDSSGFQLAEKLEITIDEIEEYMLGYDVPDSTTLIAIADALDVSVSWLMTSLEDTDQLMQDGVKYHKMRAAVEVVENVWKCPYCGNWEPLPVARNTDGDE